MLSFQKYRKTVVSFATGNNKTGLRERGKSKSIKKTLSDKSDAQMDGR